MFSISEIASEPLPVIRIVDAGAAAYETDPYARLSQQGLCEVIGFEPNAENCARRNADARPGHRYLPYALGDGRQRRVGLVQLGERDVGPQHLGDIDGRFGELGSCKPLCGKGDYAGPRRN